MFGSIPTISQSVAPPPFSVNVPTLPPATPIMGSTTTTTPCFIPSTRLFTSPSYTLPTHSTTIRTPYSAIVPQPGCVGQEGPHGNDVGDQNGAVLFSHSLNVIVQGGDGEKKQQLKITVSTSPVKGVQAKSITLVITNSEDPFFYYSLSLTEEDFLNLRTQQGLLVDFANFPTMVVQLLEKSLSEGHTSQPKFVLVLNLTKAQPCLEFTELNLFKHLVHLSLIVLRATDNQLKDYLVETIMKLTKEKEVMTGDLQKAVDSLQHQLNSKSELLQEKTTELEHYKLDHTEQSTQLEQRLAKELGELKERGNKQLQELQWKSEKEKRELESKHVGLLHQLENRVASLDVQNRDLVENKYKQEASLREVKGQLRGREEELARIKVETFNLRKDKQILESSGGDKDRRSSQLSSRLAEVEKELVGKEELVRKLQEMVKQGEDARERLAKEVEEKNKLVEKRENAVRSVTGELLKANEIIRKLQAGVKQEQGKSKLRGQIATEQERLLVEREKELGECREQLKEGKDAMSKIYSKVEDLNHILLEKNSKIEELEKVIKTNENVINWLNKQITPQAASTVAAPEPAQVGGIGTKRGARVGGSSIRGRGKIVTNVESVKNNQPDPDDCVTGSLDPKYFTSSTPGGTAYRQQIPADLPANVKRGAGLVRRIV